jgi:hypothetical protein
MDKTRTERAGRPPQPATSTAVGVGAFPLGSARSRAAARSLVEARKPKALFRGIAIRLVDRGTDVHNMDKSKCTCPEPEDGSVVFCRCFLTGEDSTDKPPPRL